MWNPWKTHWVLALVKGIREPHEVKKNSFDLGGNRTHDFRIRSTVTLPTQLRGRTDKVGDDRGGESRRRESRDTYECCTVPLLSLRRDSPPKSSPTFSVRPRSSVGRVTVYLIRRSWVRFPPRSKEFFFSSCFSPIPFTRANAQWRFPGFHVAL